jgi:hypothetical protein
MVWKKHTQAFGVSYGPFGPFGPFGPPFTQFTRQGKRRIDQQEAI